MSCLNNLLRHKKEAFTLIEILIVTAVIGLLLTILIPGVMRVRLIANEASAQATLKSIAVALENYANENDLYPLDPNSLFTAIPTYITKDYFIGIHNGYTFTHGISTYTYRIAASPSATNAGQRSFQITTGAVLQEYTPPLSPAPLAP